MKDLALQQAVRMHVDSGAPPTTIITTAQAFHDFLVGTAQERTEQAAEQVGPFLTFEEVAVISRARSRRWHSGEDAVPWSGADWSNAMCGEAGEAANVVKKLRRLETHAPGQEGEDNEGRLIEALGDELADTFLYLDLLAGFYGIDLTAAIIRKFNHTSARQGFPERLRDDR